MNVKGKGLHTAERRKALLERLCLRRHDTCETVAIMVVISSHSLMAARPSSEKEPSIMPATASLEAMSLMALCCMVCW